MSNFSLTKLKSEDFPFYNVQKFIFNMIREEYGYGFIPEYHQDIIDLENYYLCGGWYTKELDRIIY